MVEKIFLNFYVKIKKKLHEKTKGWVRLNAQCMRIRHGGGSGGKKKRSVSTTSTTSTTSLMLSDDGDSDAADGEDGSTSSKHLRFVLESYDQESRVWRSIYKLKALDQVGMSFDGRMY